MYRALAMYLPLSVGLWITLAIRREACRLRPRRPVSWSVHVHMIFDVVNPVRRSPILLAVGIPGRSVDNWTNRKINGGDMLASQPYNRHLFSDAVCRLQISASFQRCDTSVGRSCP